MRTHTKKRDVDHVNYVLFLFVKLSSKVIDNFVIGSNINTCWKKRSRAWLLGTLHSIKFIAWSENKPNLTHCIIIYSQLITEQTDFEFAIHVQSSNSHSLSVSVSLALCACEQLKLNAKLWNRWSGKIPFYVKHILKAKQHKNNHNGMACLSNVLSWE